MILYFKFIAYFCIMYTTYAIGFTDKVKLLGIVLDDLKLYKEFAVRGCKNLSFSNGG